MHTYTQVKEEQAEFEKMRARERQEDTMKNLEKKEYDKERKRRLDEDRHTDNMEVHDCVHPLMRRHVSVSWF